MLSVENVFYQASSESQENTQKKKEIQVALKSRQKLLNSSSDHLALLNVFNLFKACGTIAKQKRFCGENMINYKSVAKAI